MPRVQPIRSAITVAGIRASSVSCSRIFASTASTIDPAGLRSYFGAVADAIAARTVFLETPNFLAIALIGNPSARCSRRISAQSSTDNTPSSPSARVEPRVSAKGVKIQAALRGHLSSGADTVDVGMPTGLNTAASGPAEDPHQQGRGRQKGRTKLATAAERRHVPVATTPGTWSGPSGSTLVLSGSRPR